MKFYKTLLLSLFLTTFLSAQKPTLLMPVGHLDAITCLDYSNNGEYIVSGSKDRTIKVWTKAGRLLRNFPIHETEVVDALFSPDDQYVISRSDHKLFIWNFAGGLYWEGTCLPPPSSSIGITNYDPIQFSPDGKYLLSVNADKVPYLLNLENRTIKELPALGALSLAFSPDGQQIVANDKAAIQLYNIASQQVKIIEVNNAAAHISSFFRTVFVSNTELALTFMDDLLPTDREDYPYFKPYFLSTDEDTFQRFSKAELRKEGRDAEGNIELEVIPLYFEFTSSGGPMQGPSIIDYIHSFVNSKASFLAFSNRKGSKLYDLGNETLFSLPQIGAEGEEAVSGRPITFSPDGQQLVVLYNQQLGFYDVEKKEMYFVVRFPNVSSSFAYANWPVALDFHKNKQEVLVGSNNGTIQIYDYEGRLIRQIGNQNLKQVNGVGVSMDGLLDFYFDKNAYQNFYSKDSLSRVVYDLQDSHVAKTDSILWKDKLVKWQNNYTNPSFCITMRSTAAFGYDDTPGAAPYTNTGSGVIDVQSSNDSIPSFAFRAFESISDLGLVQNKYLLSANFRELPIVWDFGCLVKTEHKPMPEDPSAFPEIIPLIPCRLDTLEQLPPRTQFLDFSKNQPLVLYKEKDELYIEDYRGINTYLENQKRNFQLLNLENKKLVEFAGHDFKMLGATLFHNDQFVISWSVDRSCKIWDATTGKELLTLFWINEKDWVVISPNGLFDASPGMMDFLYYTIEDEIIELEQLKARYYEPGLLPKTLGYSEERIRPVDQLEVLPLYPEVINSKIENNILSFQLKARSGGIGPTSIFINSKEVVADANPPQDNGARAQDIRLDLSNYKSFFLNTPGSDNVINIRTYNADGWLKSPAIEILYKSPGARTKGIATTQESASWKGALDPKLYVVSIGTSNYTGTSLDLKYADQDATMMAKAMQYVGGALFNSGDSLEVHCLSTVSADSTGLEGTAVQWEFAEKKNIQATFKAIQQKAKAEDVIVVYMSGHGVTYGNAEQTQFHYLTQGIASEDLSDPSIREAYTISSEELTEWINDIPALKQVLIIDACNSGKVVENLTSGSKSLNSGQIRALDRMKDRTGMFILSGSASDKVSYEASEYGQGLLTYALLQGMLGLATRKDATGNDMVDVMSLFQHARNSVPELAASIQGIQTPMMGFPSQGSSFDIGILDEVAKTKIPIGNKKPVMIRSVFLNETTLLDDLELAHLLEIEFREESEKGMDANLIYVDVNEYPEAYRLGALYKKGEENIEIRVHLFRGELLINEMVIRPTDNPKRLARTIARQVKRIFKKLSEEY